ncbi:MAG TPA: hypothetical protein VFB99_17735 [Vicinamibacterales bacterium]|nr:hypothetical protein [Vicinamibacterales bacterium]
MKTWHYENAVVVLVLATTVIATGGAAVEWLGAAAVFCAFVHGSISERMREREAARPVPSVHCHRQALYYWIAKEALWASYFIAHRSWSALVGCAVFGLYPLWRSYWRRIHPLEKPCLPST